MRRTVVICAFAICAFVVSAEAVFGQSEPRAGFAIADVHASDGAGGIPGVTPAMRGPLLQGMRWELKNASMVDLIAFAWRVDPDKVLGGPSWVEFDRFDVIAMADPTTPPEKLQVMLQSLLADRFQLVLHKDTRPFAGWALTAGKNLKLRDADSSGRPGCAIRMTPGPPPDAGAGSRSAGPLVSSCRNATPEMFANFIRGWISRGQADSNVKVVDRTGLTGAYDLELKFSAGDSESAILDAVEKQTGLKLEPIRITAPVVLVDSVNRTPAPNGPEVAAAFPPIPDEFEVASLKPSPPQPPTALRAASGAGAYRGNRLTRQNATLTQLINTAWSIYSPDQLVGLPKFADTDRYDLVATVPKSMATTEGGSRDQVDLDMYRAMNRKLLIDRFDMKVHFETRAVNTWVLSTVRPKLPPADPASRTKWTNGLEPGEKDPRKGDPALNRLVHCHNMTMAEFAALLPFIAGGNQLGVVRDETGLSGSWEFSLMFTGFGFSSPSAGQMVAVRGSAGGSQNDASDPGGGISLADAIGKQLGLKLELQKRPVQVLVIDHMASKPIGN